MKPLHLIKREGVEFLAPLLAESPQQSGEFGMRLIREAKDAGCDGLRDYLRLKIDPKLSKDPERFKDGNALLNGYEAALAFLNLPIRDDIDSGVMLQLASETFQTFPGVRTLFPEVLDDVLRWAQRLVTFETTEGMVANRRTIAGAEVISTTVNDTAADYEEGPAALVTEGGRIPTWSIRASTNTVKIWKFGMGVKTTYEFERRIRLDTLTPYVARILQEIERSKVYTLTDLLVNGDGVNPAATEVDQSTYATAAGFTHTAGQIAYLGVLYWLTQRARAGVPVDVVMGDWDAFFQWNKMFAIPQANTGESIGETMKRFGADISAMPKVILPVRFKINTAVASGKLLGINSPTTAEELTEAGSILQETERLMSTQQISYYRTENTGHKLLFGDTRAVLDYGAA
jgi:hypothetical protein